MYAQTCTRPDIIYAVGLLGRYQSHPGMEHWKAAFKVMRYLQGSETKWSHKGDPIYWGSSDIRTPITLVTQTLGNRHQDTSSCLPAALFRGRVRKSHSLFLYTRWVYCYEATCQARLRKFITGLQVMGTISRPLKIYCDNSATLAFSKKKKSSSRLKKPRRKVLF